MTVKAKLLTEWAGCARYRIVDRYPEQDNIVYNRFILETCHKGSLGEDCWELLCEYPQLRNPSEHQLFRALVDLAVSIKEQISRLRQRNEALEEYWEEERNCDGGIRKEETDLDDILDRIQVLENNDRQPHIENEVRKAFQRITDLEGIARND
jgi:hypothetical protein